MDLGIKGKWALVCGASKGLGFGCAEALVREGVHVLIVARGAEAVPGPAGFAPLIAQQVPDVRLEEHPTLGHFGPLEDPHAIAAAIEDAVTAAS